MKRSNVPCQPQFRNEPPLNTSRNQTQRKQFTNYVAKRSKGNKYKQPYKSKPGFPTNATISAKISTIIDSDNSTATKTREGDEMINRAM